ncbi:sugar phosphate isomerase/epimerase family protein [Spelaeicoccus albus]|uniref:Sugar phosphate isomerase/epimerase n=1 Tax=Spelaeicoccus albus TaxID=1280376 RepID=A0A7Z0AB46_9MICO|nr:sugar phosphate isomerase/epimerase family protein [Spelaeicoccus albus]NYI66963.1 sugar phosphate isomerase/epimerase [Spelaeicoccus albus]
MSVGLSTYAYFWRMSASSPRQMALDDALRDAASLGVDVFQICDHAPLDDADDERLNEWGGLAAALGLEIEVGTRGTDPVHLARYLHIARAVGARLVRSMWTSGDDQPDNAETERRLASALPAYRGAGVTLALETYEQVPTTRLLDVVRRLDDPHLGICLDPANTVAALEHPDDVVARTAPYVRNWHVKDFDFIRSPGWVGFHYTGVPIGTGKLRYDAIHEALSPDQLGINEIVEFWLPWQGDPETTARTEADWAATTIDYLRSKHSA